MDNPSKSPASPSKTHQRRRQTIIPGSFHTHYVLWTTGFVALLAFISFVDFFGTFRQAVITQESREAMFTLIDKQMLLFFLRIALYTLSVAFFLFVLLHRIAGPIYRIRQSTLAVASGDLTHRVKLRKWDGLKDLEADFNKMTQSMQEKINEAKTAAGTVRKSLESLEESRDLSAAAKAKLAESIALLSGAFQPFKS